MQKMSARAGAERTLRHRIVLAGLMRHLYRKSVTPPARNQEGCRAVPGASARIGSATRDLVTSPLRHPEAPATRHRCVRVPHRPTRCRYDEAGVRLDVESPPARQPCSRRDRNAARRHHSPQDPGDPAHRRVRPDPGAPAGDRDAPLRRSPSGAAVDTAQVAPRAPVTGSGGERSAALAATRGNDGATRTGPHPETEAVNARAASVVRLERPLALGHGQHSSRIAAPVWRPGSGRNSHDPNAPGAARIRHCCTSDFSRLLVRAREIKPRRGGMRNPTRRRRRRGILAGEPRDGGHAAVRFCSKNCRGVFTRERKRGIHRPAHGIGYGVTSSPRDTRDSYSIGRTSYITATRAFSTHHTGFIHTSTGPFPPVVHTCG
mgnify:CR=1 FL=1